MGCRSGGDPLSLELRMWRSQKGCCAGTLLPQAVLNHVDLIILSPTLKITGPTSIFALCPNAAFAARLYRLSFGWFFLVAGAKIKGQRQVEVLHHAPRSSGSDLSVPAPMSQQVEHPTECHYQATHPDWGHDNAQLRLTKWGKCS